MYKHILLPIDGSDLSLRAVDAGIALATRIDASVFAFHVLPPFPAVTYFAELLLAPQNVYTKEAVAGAERILSEVHRRADAAGVTFDSGFEFNHRPYVAIIGASAKHKCDLIVMGSHSWHGFDRLLLGSETHKVILNCDLPVLVCH
jgi:nucleotide-binding universal stress UspA family protein